MVPVLIALMLGGCLSCIRHGHVVDFHGLVVDGGSGLPVPGIHVVVKEGARVVYDGTTGGGGELVFRYEVDSRRRDRPEGVLQAPEEPLSITFVIDAGKYGTVEIPVAFDRNMQTLSLGDIRVLHKERP